MDTSGRGSRDGGGGGILLRAVTQMVEEQSVAIVALVGLFLTHTVLIEVVPYVCTLDARSSSWLACCNNIGLLIHACIWGMGNITLLYARVGGCESLRAREGPCGCEGLTR